MTESWKPVVNAFLNGRNARHNQDSSDVNWKDNIVTLRYGKYTYAEKCDGFVRVRIDMDWLYFTKFEVARRTNYLADKLLGVGHAIIPVNHQNGSVDFGSFYRQRGGVVTLTFPLDITSYDEWMAYRMMVQE